MRIQAHPTDGRMLLIGEHGCTHEIQSLQYLIKQLVREGRLVESDCEWSRTMNGWLIDSKTYRTIFTLYHRYQRTALLNAPAWTEVSKTPNNESAVTNESRATILTNERNTDVVKQEAGMASTPSIRHFPATVGTQTADVITRDTNKHQQTQTPITITLAPEEQHKLPLHTTVPPSSEKNAQSAGVQMENDVVFSPVIERGEIAHTIVDHKSPLSVNDPHRSDGQSIRQKTEKTKEENGTVAMTPSSHASTYSGYDTFHRLHQRFGIGGGEVP